MTRRRIPGLAAESERALLAIIAELEAKIAASGAVSAQRGVSTADFLARPGEMVAIEAPSAGLSCVLPAASSLNRDARVTLVLRNPNPVRVSCIDGEVNGEELVTYTAAGVVELVSDGSGWYGWHSSMVDFADHASTSVVYASDQYRRAALTGEVAAPVNDNATTIARGTNFVWTGEHVHAQRSAAPTVGANQGAFWVEDTNPTLPVFTDEVGAAWRQGYACVSVNTTNPTATNATTNLSLGGSYSVPANTARQGTIYQPHGHYVFDHTAAVTPTLIFETLINGVVVDTITLTPVASAGTYSGWFTATIRFLTVGAGGTAMVSWIQGNTFESGLDQITPSFTTTTVAVNTTLARTIETRMRMGSAVASNTLTVIQGWIARLA